MISPGCTHCYAETFAERFRGVRGHPYEQGFDLRLVPEELPEPLRWRRARRLFADGHELSSKAHRLSSKGIELPPKTDELQQPPRAAPRRGSSVRHLRRPSSASTRLARLPCRLRGDAPARGPTIRLSASSTSTHEAGAFSSSRTPPDDRRAV
jgi:hypothetical protein